ncbi:hypothetical protein FACS189487_11190 [Campylobacterota bacterium]|nr:hypothetical protein FACS189487_11190 [Campylobacterota bacterium]
MTQNIYLLIPNATVMQQDFIDRINVGLKKTIRQMLQSSYMVETAHICAITFTNKAVLDMPLQPLADIIEIPEIKTRKAYKSYSVNFRTLMTFLEYRRLLENPENKLSDIVVICVNELLFNTKKLTAIVEELASLKGILAIFIVNVDKNRDCFSLLYDYCANFLPNSNASNTLGDFLLNKEIHDIIAIEPNKIYFDGY